MDNTLPQYIECNILEQECIEIQVSVKTNGLYKVANTTELLQWMIEHKVVLPPVVTLKQHHYNTLVPQICNDGIPANTSN